MQKYIVNNCPAKNCDYGECKQITSCPIKQVINKCINSEEIYNNDGILDCFKSEILQIFQIEEAKEEPEVVKRSECYGIDCAWCTIDCR